MKKEAVISECGLYRYSLLRVWEEDEQSARLILFIGLNPSTADAEKDDPTIRRLIGFAKLWGYGGMLMGNIFAFRSTDPKRLVTCDDPVGEYNDRWLRVLADRAMMKVACWGIHGGLLDRQRQVLKFLSSLYVFGLTLNGLPKHPLYLPARSWPIPWTSTGERLPSRPRRGFIR